MQAGGDGLAAAGRGCRDLMCGVAGVGDTDNQISGVTTKISGKGPIFIPDAWRLPFLECP